MFAQVMLALAVAAGTTTTAPKTEPVRWTLEFDRLGPVKVGMTVPEAERALRARLDPDGPFAPGECHHVANDRTIPGVRFMIEGERITRVEVTEKNIATASGAKVGTTEGEIWRMYPAVQVEQHPYDEAGHYMKIVSRDGKHALLFETDGKVVTEFRSGFVEPVGYAEGCL